MTCKLAHSLFAILFSLSGTTATAATLLVDDGQLIGAEGVLVGTATYDVTFSNLTCADLYSGCDEASDFEFMDLDIARAAGRALFDQVLLDGPAGNFDSMPDSVRGCDFFVDCILHTPWAQPIGDGFALGFFGAVNNRAIDSVGQNDLVTFGPISPFENADGIRTTRVVWTEVTSTPALPEVPLPSAALLLFSGVAGMAAMKRKAKRAA